MPLAPFYLIAVAFIGIADTLYLSYNVYLNLAPACVLSGCEVVLASSYSKLLGVPLSYWGLVFYVYMLGLVTLLAFDPRSKVLSWAVLMYTTVGVLMSVAFIYIQAVLIGAFCQYCLLSSATTATLFALALWHVYKTR